MIYIAFLLFTLFILAIAFYQWQYFLIFTPTYYRDGELDDSFEILSVTTDDGVELEGVVYEPLDAKGTLLFFGGRLHDVVGLIKRLSLIYPDRRIVSFNYRSYGKSGGKANEKNLFKDGVQIAKLVQKYYGNFYIVGFSLGSSVSSFVASQVDSLGVFLVGSFDSITSIVREKLIQKGYSSMIGLTNLFRYKFNNKLYVQNISAKTYLFVSKDDETIHIQNARNLKNHIKNLSFYEELEELNHKEILWDNRVIDKINKVMDE